MFMHDSVPIYIMYNITLFIIYSLFCVPPKICVDFYGLCKQAKHAFSKRMTGSQVDLATV